MNPEVQPIISSPLPGAAGLSTTGTSASTPSLLALPANTTDSGTAPALDASNYRKFYTITAELRETYDTNVNTSYTNERETLETTFSPSILVDFPTQRSEFTARYTFGATYYADEPSDSGNPTLSHELVAQYRYDISERFRFNASEQFIYSSEPNFFGSTGTPFRNGNNISNSFTAGLNAQWTPLFGSQTSYTNTLVRYTDQNISFGQDSDENTASQTFSFSVLPKISVNFGGIVDNITYDEIVRGYTSYTAFIGGQWQILPSLSVTARGGGSYTQTKQSIGGEKDSISPYAALTANWQIGERSSVSFEYDHEVTPTDQTGANGEQSDRLSANASYAFTSSISSHLQAIYTYSEISSEFINSSGLNAYNESTYAVDAGAAYHFNKYFDLNLDITITGVDSDLFFRTYTRDQFSVGVRGTY